jgi:LPXTG-motif cell wall-anchored protein
MPGPGPEMSAGVLGMALAAGVLYLIKRRNRT